MPVQTRRSLCKKRKAIEDQVVKKEHCTIDDECAICHQTLHSSQVYHLPCGHSFHTSCIENQIQADLQWSNLCALCRTDHEEAFSCVPALERIQNNNYERRFDLDHWEPDPEAYEDGAVAGPVDEPAAEPITAELADMELNTLSATPESLLPLIPADIENEEGIDIYNRYIPYIPYVPYPRAFYRFSNRSRDRQ